ncbi:motility associated factor glycosyltransferase family protein [Clostridium fallax]|uniref:6-hydroxymethylpterin diphosphokinase MptE-like domain-containing protein n=1 Tax=Clostridium fallax TaxID=1533 RepID=A0A1M4ULE4_9CLOT|nr:6-hydroxymethylpterin diphosphokinase MptE-like protein [Clostridium fallax]SHE57494.1 Protein of unknown function DUF115 [Clostridium fallax]SQB07627.1 putative transmembrane anchored MAF_flag10 domain protein [Clostridium fallax]
MDKSYELLETKEDFLDIKLNTLKINNIFIHSKYYPLKEAKTFIKSKEVQNLKKVAVFGLGLGYHIYEILNQNSECIVYVFDILDKTEEKIIFEDKFIKELRKNSRVKLKISSRYREVLTYINTYLKECEEIILLKSYMNIIKEHYNDLYNVLMDFDAQKKVNNIKKNILNYNYINNKKLKIDGINSFYKNYDLTNKNVFIISAGPSLNNSIEALEEISKNKENFIISVGTALWTLSSKNILPDAICILDPLDAIYKQVKPFKNSNIPLLLFYTASYKAAECYLGPKYIYYNFENNNNKVIECSNSVATAALSIGIKGNPKRIIFVGQDLAFVDNKIHSDNTIYGFEHKHYKSDKDLITESVDGNLIYTKKFFLDMKIWIERTIKLNCNNIEFINCSLGANIIGCKNININHLKDYL